jgi:hypothetical protein
MEWCYWAVMIGGLLLAGFCGFVFGACATASRYAKRLSALEEDIGSYAARLWPAERDIVARMSDVARWRRLISACDSKLARIREILDERVEL